MTDPYAVLGLVPGADERAARQRYLELVRQHPPERDPERFAEIRAAYDSLRDPVERMRRRLFQQGQTDSLTAIQEEIRERLRFARVPAEAMWGLADSP